jgi:hypothetical protein
MTSRGRFDTAQCSRCGRQVSLDSEEFLYGEATPEGLWICDGCLTGLEDQAIADEQQPDREERTAGARAGDRASDAPRWRVRRLVATAGGVLAPLFRGVPGVVNISQSARMLTTPHA